MAGRTRSATSTTADDSTISTEVRSVSMEANLAAMQEQLRSLQQQLLAQQNSTTIPPPMTHRLGQGEAEFKGEFRGRSSDFIGNFTRRLEKHFFRLEQSFESQEFIRFISRYFQGETGNFVQKWLSTTRSTTTPWSESKAALNNRYCSTHHNIDTVMSLLNVNSTNVSAFCKRFEEKLQEAQKIKYGPN